MLVVIALLLWIFGGDYINATTVALVVISLMLITSVVTWDDIVKNSAAWNTLAWFATLVALADGLNRVGFVKWFADAVAAHMTGFSPFTAMVVLVLVFYFTHYLFASVTAHVTALLPVMLAVGSTIPGMNMPLFALLLCLTLGHHGHPDAVRDRAQSRSTTAPATCPRADYWRLGAIFGVIFIVVFLVVGLPWLAIVSRAGIAGVTGGLPEARPRGRPGRALFVGRRALRVGEQGHDAAAEGRTHRTRRRPAAGAGCSTSRCPATYVDAAGKVVPLAHARARHAGDDGVDGDLVDDRGGRDRGHLAAADRRLSAARRDAAGRRRRRTTAPT